MSDAYTHDETASEIDSVFEEVAAADVALTPEAGGATDPAGAGLDQVREILLGQQTRAIEQRLTGSEQRVERAIADMQARTTERMETLEASIKGELTSLIDTLTAAREERTSQYQTLQAEIERVSKDAEARFEELAGKIDSLDESTREELTRQLNGVNEELETRVLELSNEISAETSQLRGDLVDRDSMASLLSELSLKLSARPMDSDAVALDAGEETEAMLGELLGGDGA